MNPRLFTFVGGEHGPWRVVRSDAILGEPLSPVARVEVVNDAVGTLPAGARWMLHGITSNERYVTRAEKQQLLAVQPPLGRPEATCATLIPLRKSEAWWNLTQDERRSILEERSAHIETGLRYLPAVARRLHHCRDLSRPEPFDFLTWFEYAPSNTPAFDALLVALRASEEWRYVERESDIRLVRDPA